MLNNYSELYRRFILSFVLLVFFHITIKSQDHASLMGGINKNNFIVEGTSFFETEPLNLFFAGLSLEEDMGQKWKLNTFIQYVQKGGKLQIPTSSFSLPSNLRFQFIDVVPSLEYKVSEFFGIYAGGQVGYLIRTDQKLNDTYAKVTQEYFEKINFGLVFGLKLYVGNSGFTFHWDRGLKNLINEDGGVPAQGFELYQQSFQLGFTLYL